MPEALEITLYHTPGTCSRVTMVALEEIGLHYRDEPIDVFKGAQRSPSYLSINSKGKVPALIFHDKLLTETPAILWFLGNRFPASNLFSAYDLDTTNTLGLSDAVWCASALHPLARTLRMPFRSTKGDPEQVLAAALAEADPIFAAIEQRLATGEWWNGSRWSIVDVYLNWIFDMAAAAIDSNAFPAIAEHGRRTRARPSFQRALDREQAAMLRSGIVLPSGKL